MTKVNLYVRDDQKEKLEEISDEENRSLSEVCRKAFDEYLERKGVDDE